MKPVPRSVNLALAELFKHPLSRVVPNPCVAEYTGGLTKLEHRRRRGATLHSGTANERVRRTVDTPQDFQRVVS